MIGYVPVGEELQWVAGFLEGEGSFGKNKNGISAPQKQKQPLEKLQKICGGGLSYINVKKLNDPNLSIWRWTLHGQRAVGLMMALYPLMSPRRKGQISRSLSNIKYLNMSVSGQTTQRKHVTPSGGHNGDGI